MDAVQLDLLDLIAEDEIFSDCDLDQNQRKYLSKLIDKMVANAMESMNE